MVTDPLIDSLLRIYEKPKTLQSDFCRENSHWVGRLASLGFITTALDGFFGNHWRVTLTGLRFLDQYEGEE